MTDEERQLLDARLEAALAQVQKQKGQARQGSSCRGPN
jgi:hypothetical protein